MSECCSACNEVILESQEKVRCAGPCAEIFHKTCAERNEYRKTRGVLKDMNVEKNSSHLQSDQNSQEIVTSEFLRQTEDDYVQEYFKKLQAVGLVKSDVDGIFTSHNSDLSDLKKEFSQLRIENEVLRIQNADLGNKVKALELKVDNDTNMFDEVKKILRNLSKDVEKNNTNVLDLKENLREVQDINESLERENATLRVEVRDLETRVDRLERSLQSLTEKLNSKPVAAEPPPPQKANQLQTLQKSSVQPSGQNVRTLSLPGSSTQQNYNVVLNIIGNSPVTALDGIGPVYGGRLNQCGYYKASQVYEKYLALGQNRMLFCSWLKSVCGANSRWADQCYMCLNRWNSSYDRRLLPLQN